MYLRLHEGHLRRLEEDPHFAPVIGPPNILLTLCAPLEIKPMVQFKDLSFKDSMFILDQQGEFSLNPLKEFNNITLLFGPEGGWSPNEFKTFEKNDIYKLKCNPNVLRMETAAILGTAKCIDWYHANV